VDLGIVVPGDGLVQYGSGIAVLVPAGVIGAGVAARLIIGGGQPTVGADQGLGKSVGSTVNIVRLDSDDLGASGLEAIMRMVISVRSCMRPEDVLCCHVEFHESLDLSFSFGVAGGDILRTKETSFLSGIEMELDRGGGLEV